MEENKSAEKIQKSMIEGCPHRIFVPGVLVNPLVPKKGIYYAQSVGGTEL